MILDELKESAEKRVKEAKKRKSLDEIKEEAGKITADKTSVSFKEALARPGISFICEVKKASPSKGVIAENFPYLGIARDYEAAGADAISVLTEPTRFLGSDSYLKEIANAVSLPVLRKDFTVSDYQIYEAKLLGASAVLLICAILSDMQLREYRELTESLGMAALVEAHDEVEIRRAVESGAGIIGMNNRNLKDFTVDTSNTENLKKLVQDDIIFVSESGIKTSGDVKRLSDMGVDALLIGETMMRAEDKRKKLIELKGEL